MQDATALSFGQGYTNPAIRMNNAIAYRAELKGFTAFAMYSFGGSETPAANRTERTLPPTNGDDFYGVNLQYNTTNFGSGSATTRTTSYRIRQRRPVPRRRRTAADVQPRRWVGLGPVKVYGQYLQRKNDNPMFTPLDLQNLIVATGGSLAAITNTILSQQFNSFDMDTMRGFAGPTDSQAYHLGLTWNFLQRHTLYGVYNYAKDTGRSVWATEDAVVNHYGVAYQYQFSPRTALFAAAAFMANSDQGRMTPSSAGYTTGFATSFGADTASYQLGMRHMF